METGRRWTSKGHRLTVQGRTAAYAGRFRTSGRQTRNNSVASRLPVNGPRSAARYQPRWRKFPLDTTRSRSTRGIWAVDEYSFNRTAGAGVGRQLRVAHIEN